MYNKDINFNITCNDPLILNNAQAAILDINLANGTLPNHPPFEKHPYINLAEYQMQDFEKYIIGTMPPISYILDLLANPAILNLIKPGGDNIPPPIIPFFHGNDLALWQFLLTNLEWDIFNNLPNRLEKKLYLIDFLCNNKNKINYSDIIYTAQRSNYTESDDDLKNICPNLYLINHILNNKNAKYLNFNTSSVFNREGLKVYANNPFPDKVNVLKIKSYDLFLRTLQDLGFDLDVNLVQGNGAINGWIQINSINQNFLKLNYKLKVLTKLRIKLNKTINICDTEFNSGFEREFTIITGPSPSGSANVALVGNPIYQNWLPLNAGVNPPTTNFRQHIYQLFRAGNWNALQAMNI